MPKATDKFAKVMHEFKEGKLHHGGTGKIVKRRSVAQAIAFSEARTVNPDFGKTLVSGKKVRRRRTAWGG